MKTFEGSFGPLAVVWSSSSHETTSGFFDFQSEEKTCFGLARNDQVSRVGDRGDQWSPK